MIDSYVASVIKRPIPDNRGKRSYSTRPEFLDRKTVDGKHHIIFVAYYADPHLLKKALILRATGNVYLTLLAGCIREDAQIENYFDQVYEYRDFKEYSEIVKSSQPHSWHAVTPLYHPAIIMSCGQNVSRLVVEIIDSAYYMNPDPQHPDVILEREILRWTDCVVHKMPDEAWKNLKRVFQLECPGFAVMSYPHPDFQQVPRNKCSGNPPHVVYAGGVIPYHIAVERGHENHVFDDLINLAAKDTFELSIYVNQNAREMPWHQHSRYFEFDKQNPYFHFKKGLPYHEITRALSNCDAAIFYDNLPISSYNMDHFKHNVATKIFTYIEAGLPIVIFEEDEYMAGLVKRYDLGVTYSVRKLSTILDAIAEATSKDYSQAILNYRQQFTMADNLGTLLKAHNLSDY
jgi:hypothetical protein